MSAGVIVCGATGWVGRALVPAIAAAPDLRLAAAVARSAAGRALRDVVPGAPDEVTVHASLAEALAASDAPVVIDYTKPAAVRGHVEAAIAAGRHVVIGTSGLGADDYAAIDAAARTAGVGVIAAGNFSITATLLKRFALAAARLVPDVEVIDYASASKPDAPSGTARELAEALSPVRGAATSLPIEDVVGVPGTRGGRVGAVQVHAVRMPSFVLSVEAVFGLPEERLTIRHDAGSSAAPYVAGTLLAARRVGGVRGLVRGLDALMGG